MERRSFLSWLLAIPVALKQGIFKTVEYELGIDWANYSGKMTIVRLVERFPMWLKTPDGFFALDDRMQMQLLAYEKHRGKP